jgi:hypothetical protein
MRRPLGKCCFLPAIVLMAVQWALLGGNAHAMNMPSYDTVSLVYMSTDIVIANLSENPPHRFSATVTEVLYGSLHPGDKLDSLGEFLTFFRPMKDGMHLVLFLDRRPRKYDFIYASMSKLPFAISPSGVYLIDEYGHVHTYHQPSNPGPYIAAGWYGKEPTKEEDLKLPTIEDEKARIAIAVKSVEPLRPLLENQATRADAPALLALLDRTSPRRDNCEIRMASAIGDRAMEQIRSLDDSELLLKAHVVADDATSYIAAESFIHWNNDQKFAADRGDFLIKVLSDKSRDLALRLASAELLLMISGSTHTGGGAFKVLPLNSPVLARSADELRATAKATFDNESEDANLRGLCLQFLLDQPGAIEDARRVYRRTHSESLRFMIERTLLAQSDLEFENLHSPSGAAASIVGRSATCGCVERFLPGPVFTAEFRENRSLSLKRQQPKNNVRLVFVVSNEKNSQPIVLDKFDEIGASISSDGSGWIRFTLSHLENVPAGRYSLALEFKDGDDVLSKGYGTKIEVRDTREGKQLAFDPAASKAPVGWEY